MTEFFSNPTNIALIILSIIVIALILIIINLNQKLKKFLINVDAHNIADSLNVISTNLNDLERFKKDMETYLSNVEKRLKRSVQSVHTVRFNPFKGTGGGGDQSFATAFLTEDGDGVLISSLYSREHVSVFSKPIKGYSSQHEMSEEESEALKKAKEKMI